MAIIPTGLRQASSMRGLSTVARYATPSHGSTPTLSPMTHELTKRSGNVEKCPCCGSAVDPESYFCTACRNYFCYHCRARVLPAEETYQCVNMDCSYHGKMICGRCDPKQESEEPPVIYTEPEDGFWPLLLPVSLIGGAIAWWKAPINFWGALIVAAVVFALLSGLVIKLGGSVFGRTNQLEQKRTRIFHTCLQCRQEVRSSRAE